MRDVAHSFFEQSAWIGGPLIGMLLFIAVFALVVVRVMAAGKTEMERNATMPLSDEESRHV